jgi:hypothetical protein
MATHYGNQSSALNRTKLKYGAPAIKILKDKQTDPEADCITCKMRTTFKLPLASNNKPYLICMATCKSILDKMIKDKPFLIDLTRAQLMVKYPHLGLTIRMDKATMIQHIEVYLLQEELFPNKQGLNDFN